jgi:uncharacterized membrane protein YozB (DUF420 family)
MQSRVSRIAEASREMGAVPSSTASARAETSTIAKKERVTHKRAVLVTVTTVSALLMLHLYIGDAMPNSIWRDRRKVL